MIPKKWPFFLDSSLGIPYIVLWNNVCNKELLELRNNFRVTKKFLIAKFDCSMYCILVILRCGVPFSYCCKLVHCPCFGYIGLIYVFKLDSVWKPIFTTKFYSFNLKVRQFQNEFMKSSFLPKYEQKIVKISALTTQHRGGI